MVQAGGLSLNEVKITDINYQIELAEKLKGKYLLVRRGKKSLDLVIA
jgi:tyrosyl-tRNA synthetase